MIRLARNSATLDGLHAVMTKMEPRELARVSMIRQQRALVSADFGDEYQKARPQLAEMQHGKCGYCEKRVEVAYNDVEHFRPKTTAVRGGGMVDTGYWWLAWHIPNLLFACVQCNRQYKKDSFPLAPASVALPAGWYPPGGELPGLLDPIHDDPVDHIVFRPVDGERRWLAFPRSGSMRGMQTIQLLQLNRGSLADAYELHVREALRPRIHDLQRRAESRDLQKAWSSCLRALLRVSSSFAALSHDVIDYYFPAAWRAENGTHLPHPPI